MIKYFQQLLAGRRRGRWLSGPLRLVTVLVAILPIAIVGLYSLRVTEAHLHRAVVSENGSAAALTAQALKAHLQGDIALARTLVSLPGLQDGVRRHDVDAVRDRLHRLIDQNAAFDRAYVLDAEGVLWSDWPPAPESLGRSFAQRDYYQGVIRTGQPYVSEVFQRMAEPRPFVIAVAAPIQVDGRLAAVLVFQHQVQSLAQWLRRSFSSPGMAVIMLDQRGVVAGQSNADRISGLDRRYADLPQVHDAMDGRDQTLEYVDPAGGRRMIASFQPVQVTDAVRWVIISQQDRETAYAGVAQLRMHILLAISVVAVLAFGAIWILGEANERNRRMGMELGATNRQLEEAFARQEQAQKELAEERHLFHTLLDNLPDRIYFKDAQSRFLRVNAAMAELFKTPDVPAVLGKTDFDFFDIEHAQQAFDDEQEILRTDTPIIGKVEHEILPDGRSYWVSSTKLPLHDKEGRVMGTFGISRDVTLLKEMEDELRRSNLEIATRNEQLQQAIDDQRRAHDALKAAQGQLVQSAKLAGLGQMVAGVAHEINNPLSFVSNNAAVLQRDVAALRRLLDLYRGADPLLEKEKPELVAEIRDFAEQVDLQYLLENLDDLLARSRDGLKRIAQIVKDLRDFARAEDTVMHECDLNNGVESTVGILRGRARKKKVDVTLDLGPLPPVTCNPGKINQVIMNLVANAIDACPDGGRVAVRSRIDRDDVLVEVADNGPGILPGHREHLFEPFFTTKPQGEGVGLGLSISYGIVQSHGGTIDVDSTPGQGARFIVRLPRHGPAHDGQPAPSPSSAAVPQSAGAAGHS
jgi:PAS domain S-box-containing protein